MVSLSYIKPRKVGRRFHDGGATLLKCSCARLIQLDVIFIKPFRNQCSVRYYRLKIIFFPCATERVCNFEIILVQSFYGLAFFGILLGEYPDVCQIYNKLHLGEIRVFFFY